MNCHDVHAVSTGQKKPHKHLHFSCVSSNNHSITQGIGGASRGCTAQHWHHTMPFDRIRAGLMATWAPCQHGLTHDPPPGACATGTFCVYDTWRQRLRERMAKAHSSGVFTPSSRKGFPTQCARRCARVHHVLLALTHRLRPRREEGSWQNAV